MPAEAAAWARRASLIGIHKEGKRPRDEVLEAIDALLSVLSEGSRRNQAVTRWAQTVRRLRSHGRSYADILGRNPASPSHRITRQDVEATIQASEGMDRAEVRALRSEGLDMDRIATLCGMSRTRVEVLSGDSAS